MERVKKNIDAVGVAPKIILIILAFIVMIFVGNIFGSFNASDFGMTYEEMSKEIWLIIFYLIVGTIIVLFLGRVKNPIRKFGFRLFAIVAIFAIVSNQLTVSYELAPIKREFALAMNECRVTDFRKLSCGKKLKESLMHRDAKLNELGAVMFNSDGWKVTAVSKDTIVPNRSGVYLHIPFH